MLFRKLVVVGLVGFASLTASIATAEDAVGPSASFIAMDGANFADPSQTFDDRFSLGMRSSDAPRFSALTSREPSRRSADQRRYELALTARGAGGFDVAFSQRAGVAFNREGDIERESRASELRLGRGLRGMRRDRPSDAPSLYIFAASEDEALIWRPGSRSEFGGSSAGFALQDRVEIGDVQAGVTYEANGWQASLAYVQREISVRSGSRTISEDEDFTGLTLTMRR